MALTSYNAKRDFKKSPEPTGGKPDSDHLRFVIQKHDATRMHFDFRLEIGGVLKSWAVPKGPSTDPDVKRLAIMVEDHPYDYRTFEGIIPSGYGAGTVMVWDEGIYASTDADSLDKKLQDKALLKGIQAGKLHIVLHGQKLKGEFALVKTNGKGDDTWLLFKVKDKYVSKKDVTLKDKSVISGKTLTEIEKSPEQVHGEKQAKTTASKSKGINPSKKGSVAKSVKEAKETDKESSIINGRMISIGKTAKFPVEVKPMLATSVDKPFDQEGWQYEIKWDGYRTIAFCNKKSVELKSRNGKSFNEKFDPVVKALQQLNLHAVMDGEVVVLDENGKSDFGTLQNWKSIPDGDLHYYVFDLLWLNGKSLVHITLDERRTILQQIIPEGGTIRISENFDVSGIAFFEAIKKMGLEGIMAKKSDSLYMAGNRSKDWLKIKAHKGQEMVIGGYTKNEGSSKAFSSLLLGVYERGKLIYTGKAGTGFSDQQQVDMLKQFKPYIIQTPPFASQPDINKSSRFQRNPPNATAVWMKPELVCEVNFTEMTTEGIMRHPSFVAMRADKKAKEVIKETDIGTELIVQQDVNGKEKVKPGKKKVANGFLDPTAESDIRSINGHKIKFTNLNKLYWLDEKITKRDMLNYYDQISSYILPYLKDRPQSMNRHPNGIHGKSFYYKDVTGTAPDWVETYKYKSESDNQLKHYLVATNEASLLYMATLGCIEMNPWHSRVKTEDYPDWCIIDLDPAAQDFQKVVEAALVTKDILEGMGVPSYPKTSGSTGIHIYIPLGAKYTYDQSKEFARVIATLVQREIPTYTSIERIVKARKGKMYIDFLQNRSQATVTAPYSLRPKPGATVSMPLEWNEVKTGLKMTDFTIYNALDRIKSMGDIFKPVLGKGVHLEKVIETFQKK